MSASENDEEFDRKCVSFLFEALPYNQPIFAACARWYQQAVTFINASTIGGLPIGIFVDTSNTVYVADKINSTLLVWYEGNSAPARVLKRGLNTPYSTFVTPSGDIYVDNGGSNKTVYRWRLNSQNSSVVMTVEGVCYGLFVDVFNNIYCSLVHQHQVVRRLSTTQVNATTVVAGNATNGSSSDMLSSPHGIFVTYALNLYVADCDNDRVQLFLSGQRNATTVVGNSIIDLNCPNGVVLDGSGYVFITDSNNNRIIGSGRGGYRCIVGCSRTAGSASNQLNNPRGLSFDRDGNIYVADGFNDRVQKFILARNTCGKSPRFIERSSERTLFVQITHQTQSMMRNLKDPFLDL